MYKDEPDVEPLPERRGYYRVKYLCFGDGEKADGAHLVIEEKRAPILAMTDCPVHRKPAHLSSFYEDW